MKATCLVGSARANGSTAYLAGSLMNGLRDGGADTKILYLGDCRIGFCRGCKQCYTDGKCVQHDDVEPIVRELLSSDVVVIASPSYWGDVPGQLKTFFDRNTPYGDTNANRTLKAEKKIRGVAIAVRAAKRNGRTRSFSGLSSIISGISASNR